MKTAPDRVHPLWDEFCGDLNSVSSLVELSALRDKYLGRKRGLISLELRKLGALSPQERPAAGHELNELKKRVEKLLSQRTGEFKEKERLRKLEMEGIDVTLPGYAFAPGAIHPVRRVWKEMEEIFVRMGFAVVSGPEVESDYYNFEALNIPKGHPARDDQATLYLSENLLLRTHTSPVQIRTMENQKPPLRIIVPGRVYRRDAVDATHTPMFHQIEGLLVDEGITLADLKGTLEVFFKALFSPGTRVRLRPSYFPFVEPGAEVDISCIFCAGGGCRVCKKSGWIEILGAGMVHPRIFERVGYDPEKYTGFAWGMGIDRIALLKYQVNDLRLFFENDVRFLRQF
ncbi:MAG: phenylalanine--tRNA ligase subunit alpha [Acidobacteriota bacterium]